MTKMANVGLASIRDCFRVVKIQLFQFFTLAKAAYLCMMHARLTILLVVVFVVGLAMQNPF
jgi:hypothetical protein